MADVLVLVDGAEDPAPATLELLTVARELGTPAAVVFGPAAAGWAPTLAEYGAAVVYVLVGEDFDSYLVGPKAEALAQLVDRTAPAAVLVTATPEPKEIAARLAVRIGSGLLTDAVAVNPDFSVRQPVFGGGVVVTARVRAGVPVIALRPNSATPTPAPAAGAVVEVAATVSPAAKRARIVERVVEDRGSRPSLIGASAVVSGGRGLGSADNFRLVEDLADRLGAAIGASRAATDAGWVPDAWQVGQTGVTVAPGLYVAVGISGAIQHRAGMQTAQTIVAINKDPAAPIFRIADFGVVGDLFQVVPQLTAALSQHAGHGAGPS